MNIFKKTYLLSLAICLQFCKQKGNSEISTIEKPSTKSLITTEYKNDSICKNKVRDFLTWYLKNSHAIDSSNRIINYPKSQVTEFKLSEDNISKSGYYEVNKIHLNGYINTLSKSNYFSNFYLNKKKQDILKRGSILSAAKQNDGPAEGFEFDEVFTTQEMYTLESINNLRVDNNNKNAYVLPIMEGFGWIIYTTNKGNTCLIDSIGSL